MPRIDHVTRRLATLMLASALLGAAPAVAAASDASELLAQGNNGGLTDNPRPTGGLSESATPAGKAEVAAAAEELPFTGSDPRITLLLGAAALLAGAGLRLRTGDARDF